MKKILIVEDEFIIADRIKHLLDQKPNWTATIRDTYQDSIDWIKKELPDLVLLDIRLFDDEDAGIRIARFILDRYNIPFAFLSGYSDEETLKSAKLFKPVTFITKPVIEKQLLAAVEIALPANKVLKLKSTFLKGKYFNNISYEKLSRTDFSRFEFVNKEIRFSDVAIIQAFNNIKRNTVLFKFTQADTFFVFNSTIEKIKEILPPYFEQVHQSYIVNSNYITARRNGHFVTVLNEDVPMGNTFK